MVVVLVVVVVVVFVFGPLCVTRCVWVGGGVMSWVVACVCVCVTGGALFDV